MLVTRMGGRAAPPKRAPRAGRLLVEHRGEGFMAIEDCYAGYTVYDQDDQMELARVRVRM